MSESVELIYKGMRYTGRGKFTYVYGVIAEEDKNFVKKLQKHHRVGLIYPSEREGSSYVTKRTDELVGVHEDPLEVSTWIRQNMDAERIKKAISDQRRYVKAAKNAVKDLRLMYQRADIYQRLAILEEVVKELTEIR